MITAEFINGPQDGYINDLPGIVPEWHIPFVKQDLIHSVSGVYVYRLKYPGKRTIYDYDLKNAYVPYVFVEQRLNPALEALIKGENK